MKHIFFDESGTDDALSKLENYVVGAAVITGTPRPVEVLVRRLRKKLRRPAWQHISASITEATKVAWFLGELTEEEVELISTVGDKTSFKENPSKAPHPKTLYAELVIQTLRPCIARHPRIEVWLHKKYTKRADRDALEKAIRERVADLYQEVLIIHQEPIQVKPHLLAADFVAWAIYQASERADDTFYQLIESKLVEENVTSFDHLTK